MKQSGAAWPRSPSRWFPTGTRLAHATRYISPWSPYARPVRLPLLSANFRNVAQRRRGSTTTLHGYVRGITRPRLTLGTNSSDLYRSPHGQRPISFFLRDRYCLRKTNSWKLIDVCTFYVDMDFWGGGGDNDAVAHVPPQFLRCPICVLLNMIDGTDRLI